MLTKLIEESVEAIRSLESLEGVFEAASNLLVSAFKGGGKVLVCGNGGSAADAMHMSTELVCRFESQRRHLPAICLNSSSSDITAFANDFKYEEVFSRQVKAFAKRGDVLVVFSTSGMSSNIVYALKEAREMGIESIALLGREGGDCGGLASLELVVPSQSTARIQEAHKLLIHALCSNVDSAYS